MAIVLAALMMKTLVIHKNLGNSSLAPHNPRTSQVDPNAAIIPSGAIFLPQCAFLHVTTPD
jgi:hypothetical protein